MAHKERWKYKQILLDQEWKYKRISLNQGCCVIAGKLDQRHRPQSWSQLGKRSQNAMLSFSCLGNVILPWKSYLNWEMGIVGNDIYLPGQYYTEGEADKRASIPGAALEENLRKKSKEETKGLHSFETRVACAQKPGHKCHSSGGKGFGDPSQENVEHGPWRSQVRCCRKTKADSENLAPSFLPPSPAACNVVQEHKHRINAFFPSDLWIFVTSQQGRECILFLCREKQSGRNKCRLPSPPFQSHWYLHLITFTCNFKVSKNKWGTIRFAFCQCTLL